MSVRAVEFYCGIGGMRRALERSNVDGVVVRAIDFDHAACQVYALNYPDSVMKIDIATLTADSPLLPQADLWLLSPPCQPYTVLSSQKDSSDPRAQSFLYLIGDVLPNLAAKGAHPRYLLVENVAAFETSNTRQFLLSSLKSLYYTTFECLLSPLQFGIPNSRLRYYLLAKKFPGFSHSKIADNNHVWRCIPSHGSDISSTVSEHILPAAAVTPVRFYMDETDPLSCADAGIPDRVLAKWGRLFDIVLPSSRRTCCFTRGYTQLVEGTGSILQINEDLDTKTIFDDFLTAQLNGDENAVHILKPLALRYFTPTELLRLFGFERRNQVMEDDIFLWPSNTSTRTKYRLIGNSVNVQVVTELINFLFQS